MNNVYLLIFAAVGIGIATKVLHELYLNAGDFKRKAWKAAPMQPTPKAMVQSRKHCSTVWA